jgi:hypothetical protein
MNLCNDILIRRTEEPSALRIPLGASFSFASPTPVFLSSVQLPASSVENLIAKQWNWNTTQLVENKRRRSSLIAKIGDLARSAIGGCLSAEARRGGAELEPRREFEK